MSLSVLVQLPFISIKGTNWQEVQTGTWCAAHGLIPAGNTISGKQNAIVYSPSMPTVFLHIIAISTTGKAKLRVFLRQISQEKKNE